MPRSGYIVAGVIVLVLLWTYVRPKSATAPGPSASSTTASATATPLGVNLVVKNKKLVSGPDTIIAKQGDTVSITITNDAAEELHLHGYNKMVDLEADKPATLTFVADTPGRFEYELEHSSTVLGALEVQPK